MLLRFFWGALPRNRPLRGYRRTTIEGVNGDCVGGLYACVAGILIGKPRMLSSAPWWHCLSGVWGSVGVGDSGPGVSQVVRRQIAGTALAVVPLANS